MVKFMLRGIKVMKDKIDDYLKYNYIIDDMYYAKLEKKNRFVLLYVEFKNVNDYQLFLGKIHTNICAKSVIDQKEIFLLNCEYYGCVCSASYYKLIYRVDYISEYKLYDLDEQTINNVSVSFDDVNWFIGNHNNAVIDFDNNTLTLDSYSKKIELSEFTLNICKLCDFRESNNEIVINKDIKFYFYFSHKKSFNEIKKCIYAFRNLLMLIGKRHINVNSLIIWSNNQRFEICDCFDEYNFHPINERLKEYLDHLSITLESISNFEIIVNNYYSEYKNLLTIIDSYFNSVKYSMAPKVKFINATTMIEDYSNIYFKQESKEMQNEYDESYKNKFVLKVMNVLTSKNYVDKSKEHMIVNDLNRIVYRSKEVSFQSKLKIIIKKVNTVFNFDEDEIEIIVDNIKTARRVCVHAGIFPSDLDCKCFSNYAYFIEDLILLNIYDLIGLNNNTCFLDFYYKKSDLLNHVNYE